MLKRSALTGGGRLVTSNVNERAPWYSMDYQLCLHRSVQVDRWTNSGLLATAQSTQSLFLSTSIRLKLTRKKPESSGVKTTNMTRPNVHVTMDDVDCVVLHFYGFFIKIYDKSLAQQLAPCMCVCLFRGDSINCQMTVSRALCVWLPQLHRL